MIILLVIRLIAVIPMYIDFISEETLIVPAYETLIWLISEILPALVLMFSFINFGSSSKDDIESLDDRSTLLIQSDYNNSVDNYIFMKQDSKYKEFVDSDFNSEDSKEQEVMRYSFSNWKRKERDKTTINPSESITSTDSDSNDGTLENQNEFKDRTTLYPIQKLSSSPIEEDIFIHRESHLKGIFRQMINDIGVDRPSQITLSAMDDDD